LLSAFTSAFRTPDLRKKLLFTVAIVAVYRLGATLPSPGVSYTNVRNCLDAVQNSDSKNLLTLLNLFSGGALLQLSVFSTVSAVGVVLGLVALAHRSSGVPRRARGVARWSAA